MVGLALMVAGSVGSVRFRSGIPFAGAAALAVGAEVMATARAPIRVVSETVRRLRRLARYTILALATLGLLVALAHAIWR